AAPDGIEPAVRRAVRVEVALELGRHLTADVAGLRRPGEAHRAEAPDRHQVVVDEALGGGEERVVDLADHRARAHRAAAPAVAPTVRSTAATTSATSSSLRADDSGSENVRSPMCSAFGNCPSRPPIVSR